jgi:hypothetical protein
MMQFLGRCFGKWIGGFVIIFAAVVLSVPAMAQFVPWHNVYDSGFHDAGYGVAIDSNGNVIVVGYRGTEPPGTPLGQGINAYMRKYNHLGTFMCEREVIGNGIHYHDPFRDHEVNESFYGVAVDSQDNIIIAGTISGDYWTDGSWLISMYLNKYNGDCEQVWGDPVIYKYPGDSAWQGANSVTLDANDNIYATGNVFAGWGGPEHEWATWKYDTNGALQTGFPIFYNYSPTSQYVDYSYDVAVDSIGNIIVVGVRGQGIGNYDGHVRKYDPAGTLIWSDTYAGTANLADYAYRVAVDSQDQPIVVGYTNKGTDNSANANYDWLTIKYAVDGVAGAGQRLWEKTYESAPGQSEASQAVAVDENDNVILGGYARVDSTTTHARLAVLDGANGNLLGEKIITDPINVIPVRLAYRSGTIAIGGYINNPSNNNMYVALLEIDIIPNSFAFIDQTDVAWNTLVVSNEITVTGINADSAISIIGGEYSISGGAYTSTAGFVNNLDTVRVRQTSSSSYSTTTNATLTIGGVSDTFSVKTVAAIGPTNPADGETFTACSYYDPPLFQWTLNQAFQKLEIRIFTPANPAKPAKVNVKDPTATQLPMTQATWKKILKLPGLSGGTLNWKIVGTNKGFPAVESEVFTMTIASPDFVGNPVISPVTQSGIPTLTWGNSCGTKFKAYFSADGAFSKSKKLSFKYPGSSNPDNAFSATLTDKTWLSIRKLIEDVAHGPHIYWKVESWDIIKRYKTTDVMEFTLLP